MYRRSGRGRVVLLAFLVLSIAVITLDFRQGPGGIVDRARDAAGAVVGPVQRGFATVARPVRDFLASVGDLADLRRENEELRDRVLELEAKTAQAEAIEEENERITALIDLQESWAVGERVAARVYGRGPSNYTWTGLIDKGSADGVRPDMAVINTEGLVGKVLTVAHDSSVVLLLIDPEAAAGARVETGGPAGPTGVVRGNGSDENLSLDFIGTRAEVSSFDDVVTSGYDRGIFPPGIPIGVISDVGGEESDLQKEIEVDPAVDFTALSEVWVLLETGPRYEPPRATAAQGRE